MRASVLITTKNRKEELRRALNSVDEQSVSVETIVLDDASADGTADMVRVEFPKARLVQHEDSRGLIVRRNEGARLATAAVIFSIDDDAVFSSPHIVEQTLAEFDHPQIGAVAIPCIDVHKSDKIRQRAPEGTGVFVGDSYIGTAHAVRRDVFLRVGGYRIDLVHQGEERDFCIRMLAAGYVTRAGRADPIHHYESPKRSSERMDFYGRRNDILFAWHNVPMPYLPLHLAGTTVKGLFHAATQAVHPTKMLSGIINGYGSCFKPWSRRHPVSGLTYRLHRRLKKKGPVRLGEIEDVLSRLVHHS